MSTKKAIKQGPKGARTRQLIKDTVAALYERDEAGKVTIDRILKETQLTVGAFYFHFENKEELLEEIVIDSCDQYHLQITQNVDWSADFRSVAREVITGYFLSYKNNPRFTALVYKIVYTSPRAYAGWLKSRKVLRKHIEAAVVKSAALRKDGEIDPAFVSYWLLSSLEDFVFSVFMSKGSKPLHDIAAQESMFVDQQALLWARAVESN